MMTLHYINNLYPGLCVSYLSPSILSVLILIEFSFLSILTSFDNLWIIEHGNTIEIYWKWFPFFTEIISSFADTL